jgi:hypothetical protein
MTATGGRLGARCPVAHFGKLAGGLTFLKETGGCDPMPAAIGHDIAQRLPSANGDACLHWRRMSDGAELARDFRVGSRVEKSLRII